MDYVALSESTIGWFRCRFWDDKMRKIYSKPRRKRWRPRGRYAQCVGRGGGKHIQKGGRREAILLERV